MYKIGFGNKKLKTNDCHSTYTLAVPVSHSYVDKQTQRVHRKKKMYVGT